MSDKPRCKVSDVRNGVLYRCTKDEGHGDDIHEVAAAEYAYDATDWRQLFEAARPILEHAASRPMLVGQERSDLAKRVLIRAFMAIAKKPGLVKTIKKDR